MTYRSTVRDQKKRDTRRALVEAAVALFLEHGTEGPSLDAICEVAGCTRGAFYVHFASREELIIAALDLALGEFIGRIMGEADFIDAFLAAITSEDPLVGGAQLRLRHLLEACARYPEVRRRYLVIIETSRAAIRAKVSGRHAGDRSTVVLLIALGLLVTIDLEQPIEIDGVRAIVRQLVAA